MVCFCLERQLRGRAEDSHGSWTVYNLYAIARFLEFVAGLVVIGLYAQDVHLTGVDGSLQNEVYGVVVGVISAIAALVFMFPHIRPGLISVVADCVIFLLFVVLFAIWGKIYIGKADPGLGDTEAKDNRLHHAVYVDAAAMVLWFVNAMYSSLRFARDVRARKSMPGPSEMEEV